MLGLTRHILKRRRTVQLTGEIIASTKADEASVDAVVNQPKLYSGVQARIAAKQRSLAAVESGQARFGFSPFALRVALAGAAMIVLMAIAATVLWQKDRSQPQSNPAAVKDQRPRQPVENLANTSDGAAKVEKPQRAIRRRQPVRRAEIVSDFIPLTYLAEGTAVESGVVVRVRVPRSMLTRMGLPINAEIAEETVLADVALGDDGLARAIRFVN